MSAPRAVWKGHLKVGSVSCAIKLVGATTEAEKIHFRILNRKTKKPVRSAYVDEVTGDLVEAEDQVKGFDLGGEEFLQIDPEEIKALKLSTEHTMDVEGFVPIDEIDQRYLEKPYHVIPADRLSTEAFAVIREAMERKGVAARSCIVLYQRGREVILQPEGQGMLMTTLRTHAEVVSEKSAFEGLSRTKTDPEMVEFASLLIDKKSTKFDPGKFEDTYENALIEMIKAKREGKAPPKAAPRPKENVVNLAEVLRKSLEKEGVASKRKAASGRKRSAA
jgi:Ku protein, prokaryotic